MCNYCTAATLCLFISFLTIAKLVTAQSGLCPVYTADSSDPLLLQYMHAAAHLTNTLD